LIILLGFGLAHVPGVTDFVSQYIDIVLIVIVVVSVVPIVVREIIVRKRAVPSHDAE
jgi:membrane-associated protein